MARKKTYRVELEKPRMGKELLEILKSAARDKGYEVKSRARPEGIILDVGEYRPTRGDPLKIKLGKGLAIEAQYPIRVEEEYEVLEMSASQPGQERGDIDSREKKIVEDYLGKVREKL